MDNENMLSGILCISLLFHRLEGTSRPEIKVGKLEPDTIKQLVTDHKIVPDVIDVSPKHAIKVHWLHGITAKFGNTLVPEDLRKSPFLIKWPIEKGAVYLLMMVDPDVPSRKNHTLREWNHWMFVNMPAYPLMLFGDTLVKYVGPDPLEGTGFHRYIFLIFKQPGNLTFNEPVLKHERNNTSRGHFSTRKFANKYKLGDPIAINFFIAEWRQNSSTGSDDYSYDAYRVNGELPHQFKNLTYFDKDKNDDDDDDDDNDYHHHDGHE
nr:PREDICTED: protein D1-like isoform X2 [Bemisia tabaci]